MIPFTERKVGNISVPGLPWPLRIPHTRLHVCIYLLILWTWDSRFHGRIDWTGNARYREKSLHPREMRLLLSLGFAAV